MTYAATGPGAALPEVSSPVEVRFGERLPQSRLTAFFRLIMVIPQVVVLIFVGIAAAVVLIIGWFGALFTGRLPQFAVEFLSGYLRWETRVLAYEYFLTGTYPPFSLQPVPEYPVDIWVQTGRLNRWSVLFRIILAIPASIVATVIIFGLSMLGIVLWVTTVIRGELAESFFDATAAAIRFQIRYSGFYFMLTSVYPAGVYGDGKREEATPAGQWGPAPAAWPPVPQGAAPAWPTPTPGTVLPTPPPPAGGIPLLAPPPVGATPTGAPPIAPPPAPAPAYGVPPAGTPSYPPPPADAPTYGMPPTPAPSYGPPPVAAPVFEPPVPWSPWRLLLSKGARVVLTIYIVLGAVGYVGYLVFVNAATHVNQNAITAQNQAVDAYNALSRESATFSTASAACTQQGSSATQVQCLEAADAALATALTTYADQLANISFPSSVSTQADAAHTAAVRAAAVVTQVAGAGSDAQAYGNAVQAAALPTVLGRVDTTFNDLDSALQSA